MALIVDILQGVGSIATALSFIYIMKQAKASEKSYQYTCDWQSKNKAVELAEYYKDNILTNVEFITLVLKRAGVVDLLKSIRNADIQHFTADELHGLTDSKIIEEVEALLSEELKVNSILAEIQDKAAIFPTENADFMQLIVASQIAGKNKKITIAFLAKMFIYIDNTLNSLEYFAMHFTSGVADESIVYPSLHQSFFSCVRALYHHIASQNKHPKDKYYTNIIELYHLWNLKDVENTKKAELCIEKPQKVKK